MTTEEPMLEALRAADDALRSYACHGGPGTPCLRSQMECRLECGKEAGDALIKVEAALALSRTPPVDQDEVERMRARIVELDAECERAWESYRIAHDQAMANGEALANARHLLNGDASIGSGAGDVREALMEAGKAFKRLAKGDVGQPENLAFNAWQMIEGVLGEPVQ